ncbi:unnamed protein product, partial [Choristocarpus tenellus]
PHYTPIYTNIKALRRKQLDATVSYGKAGPCTQCCFIFSLVGVFFLSWLGSMLARGSTYIIFEEDAPTKLLMSRPIFGAAAMYLVCVCITGYAWFKTVCGERRLPTMDDHGL